MPTCCCSRSSTSPVSDPAFNSLTASTLQTGSSTWSSSRKPHREQLVAFLEALQADPGAPTPFPAIRTTSVRVKAAEPVCLHIDGRSEEVRAPVDLKIGIRRHAVRFLGGPNS